MAVHKYSAFLKVIELGSISKAADELGYTQSAVSRMIADLENEWGLMLLKRSRAGLALSSDGIEMLPYVRALCEKYREMQDQANAIHGLETGLRRALSVSAPAPAFRPSGCRRYSRSLKSYTHTSTSGWRTWNTPTRRTLCSPGRSTAVL